MAGAFDPTARRETARMVRQKHDDRGMEHSLDDFHPQGLRKRSAQGAVVMLSSQSARFSITFVYQVIITHLLAPSSFGLIAMVGPMVAFIYMFNTLGLTQVTVQKEVITHTELSCLFWITAAFGLLVALVGVALAPAVGWFYGDPRTVDVMALFSSTLIFAGLSAQHIALLNRRMQFVRIAIIEVSAAAAGAASAIWAALDGWGYWALVTTSIVTSLVTMVLAWMLAGWRPALRPDFHGVGGMLRFGGNVTGFNMMRFLSQNLQNVLIGRLDGPTELGFYDRAYKLMLLPLVQIQQPMARVAIPVLSRLNGSPDRYRRAYTQMLQAIHLAAVPGVICGIALPGPIVTTLFGQHWAFVAPFLFWLSIFGVLSFLSGSSGWLFISQARTGEYLRVGAVTLAIYITAFMIGVHTGGAVGVARAYALASVLFAVPFTAYRVTRRGPVSLSAVSHALWPFAVAAISGLVAIGLVHRVFSFEGVGGVAAGFAVSYGASWGTLLCLPAGRRIFARLLALKTVLFERDSQSLEERAGEKTTA